MKHILNICLLAFILTLMNGCSSHANYPVSRMADWVPKRHVEWEALELSAKFKRERFKWSRSKGHIQIKAKIKISENENSVYKIKKLHIVQRYIEEDDIEKIASIKVRGSKRKSIS